MYSLIPNPAPVSASEFTRDIKIYSAFSLSMSTGIDLAFPLPMTQ